MKIEYEYRPCRIKVQERTKHGSSTNVYEGLFHCWVSEKWVHTPLMRDEVGGQMQSTYGLVELRTGEVRMFSPNQIQFLDSKMNEYAFPETNGAILQAISVVRGELLKHGDLYDGFLASIESALSKYQDGQEVMDDGYNSKYLSELVLNRLIGEE